MNTYASSSYEEQMVNDLRGVDAVQPMTVHQAKGLECEILFENPGQSDPGADIISRTVFFQRVFTLSESLPR
jgi:hypothetical protein